jgi:hypothetical protein
MADVDFDQLLNAAASSQNFAQTPAAKSRRQREDTGDIGQAVGQAFGCQTIQKIVGGVIWSCPVAAAAVQGEIEDFPGTGHGRLYCRN